MKTFSHLKMIQHFLAFTVDPVRDSGALFTVCLCIGEEDAFSTEAL